MGMAAHGHNTNPAVSGEQYRLAQAVLSGTARDTGMPVKVAREIVERTPARLRSEYSRNPVYGMDLDLETDMAPAWKYYDSKKARDMDARLKEGQGKKVVLGYSFFGFNEGGGKKYRMRLADHRGNPSKSFGGNVRQQLLSAVTQYDMKEQAKAAKRGPRGYYNMYALPQYLGRVSDVMEDIEAGTTVRKALTSAFTGRLLDATLKAVGETRSTKEEQRGGPITYSPTRGNPQPAADDMYASFHGEQSDETIEIEGEEHYHAHLAALGELVELKVKLVVGGTAVIGFESNGGKKTENPSKVHTYLNAIKGSHVMGDDASTGLSSYHAAKAAVAAGRIKEPMKRLAAVRKALHAHRVTVSLEGDKVRVHRPDTGTTFYVGKEEGGQQSNPFWPFNSLTHTTIYHVGTGEKYKKSGSYKGYTLYQKLDSGEFLVPALDKESRFDTKKDVTQFVDSWVKHRKNPGPFHEAGKLLRRGTKAVHKPVDQFLSAAGSVGGYLDNELGRAINPGPSSQSTGPVYLTSNEDGTQLYITGGDQSLDLPGLGITGPQADKELVTIGSVTNICYHAHKIFDGKREEFDYVHKFSEDSHGPLPILTYDRINQQLKLSGGVYKIERPLIGTSPGIED